MKGTSTQWRRTPQPASQVRERGHTKQQLPGSSRCGEPGSRNQSRNQSPKRRELGNRLEACWFLQGQHHDIKVGSVDIENVLPIRCWRFHLPRDSNVNGQPASSGRDHEGVDGGVLDGGGPGGPGTRWGGSWAASGPRLRMSSEAAAASSVAAREVFGGGTEV